MRTIHARLRRAGCGLLLAALVGAPHVRASPQDFGRFSAADVLLVVAPHPDDETLCCAGAIQRAHAAGARVAIVWITSGDGFELDAHIVEHRLFTGTQGLLELARLRMQEAARAAQLLSVAPADRFFLGYPDGGIEQLLTDNHDLPLRSPHTGVAAVPYAEAYRPGAAYTGANLERDLRAVVDRVQPTWLLAPTPLDEHADHRATGELVMRAMGTAALLGHGRAACIHKRRSCRRGARARYPGRTLRSTLRSAQKRSAPSVSMKPRCASPHPSCWLLLNAMKSTPRRHLSPRACSTKYR